MEKSNFDTLMERYLTDQVTEEEKVKIEAWLNVLKTDNADLELTREEEEKLYQKIKGNLGIDHDFAKSLHKKNSLFSSLQWPLGIAAVLVILTVSFIIWNSSSDGVVDKMILTDGSLVWIRGESKLVYYEKPGEQIRYADFTGEALFEIAKDPSRPFLIKCGTATIKVLGTSFNLKSDKNGLEVEVLTGKVNISSQADSIGVDVTPNQKVIYRTSGPATSDVLTDDERREAVKSTEYEMMFEGATVETVLRRIEKKFNVNLKSNSEINNCKVTADFTDHSLEGTLAVLSDILDFKYTINGKEVTISGGGCK